MIDSQGTFERASERRFGNHAARADARREPPLALAEPLGQTAPNAGHTLRVQATLALFVLGALLVLLSVRAHSDAALLSGCASLLASTLLHRHTRARVAARLARRALAGGVAAEQARAQSLREADALLASLGRGERADHMVATSSSSPLDGRRPSARSAK